MQFRYRAYSLEQGIVKGFIEANDVFEVRRELELQKLKPIKITEGRQGFSLDSLLPGIGGKVKKPELVRFSRQLSTMVTSGASLLLTLEMLQDEASNPMLKKIITDIRKTLDEGGSFSQALGKHPKVFDTLFTSVIEVGEYTGRLGMALEQLSDILEKEHEAKQKAIRTLMFPVAIMGMSIGTLALLMTVAMPPLMKVFDQMGAEVPLMTKIALAGMKGLKDNFLTVMGVLLVAFVALKMSMKSDKFAYAFHGGLLRAPILGGFLMSGELARSSRTMAMLLDAGVPLADALHLSLGGIKNRVLKAIFVAAEDSLISGHGFTEALKDYPILPSMYVQLVMLGEESNALQQTLTDVADTYQKQVERQLDGLLAMLEPASTLFVGGIVGFIAFSMFVPIYSSVAAVGQ